MTDRCTLNEQMGPFEFKYGNTWVAKPRNPHYRRKNIMSWGTFCDNEGCDFVERGTPMKERARWRSYCMPMTDDEASKDYGRQEEVEFCSRACLNEWLAFHPDA